ncbi:MAG: hypothetical protein ACYDHH_12865 [Solirubrobacteraceae bacterium]
MPNATCAFWAVAAIVSGLLSMSGFMVAFDLVFGAQLTWRQSAIGGLRALGATAALPAGALLGPAAAASSVASERQPPHVLARSAVALTILTNAPGVIALTLLGLALSLGLTAGARDPPRTLLPAAIAAAILAATLLAARTRNDGRRGRIRAAVRALKGGALDARAYLASGDWRLAITLLFPTVLGAAAWGAMPLARLRRTAKRHEDLHYKHQQGAPAC